MNDFIEQWRAGGSVPPSRLGRNSINKNRWDKRRFDDLIKEMRPFNKERKALCEVTPTTGDGLWEDAFNSFQKAEPTLNPDSSVRPDHLINKSVMGQALELSEYLRLKAWTTGDQVAAGAACIAIRPELEQLYDRNKTAQKLAEKFQETLEQLAAEEDAKRDLDQLEKDWSEQDQAAQDKIDQLQKTAEEEAAVLEKMLNQSAASNKSILRNALSKAADDAEQTAEVMQAFGIDPGTLTRIPAEKRLELARRLNTPRFKRMVELFGPLQQMMLTQNYREVNNMPQEIFDITLGNNLEHLLPSEFAKLLDPIRKLEFYKNYSENRLLQYELRGDNQVARGGIVCCIDTSGSMSGDPELWGKAIGLALASLCQTQKREFRGILFSSQSEIMEFDFTKSFDLDKIIDFAEWSFRGGTDFCTPLDLAIKHLTKEFDTTGRTSSDCVFVTDGECSVPAKWEKDFHKEMERIGSTLWGVQVGVYGFGDVLKNLAKGKVITVADILNPGVDLQKIFQGVRNAA